MIVLDSVSCGDNYTEAATLAYAYGAPGGFLTVAANDVFCQLAYGRRGAEVWMSETRLTIGTATLSQGVIGVRCRNHTAGKVATITAGLSSASEPVFVPVTA